MKFKLIFLLVIAVFFSACSSESDMKKESNESLDDIDYDLRTMSETMVYSHIFDLMLNPTEYENTRFIINGSLEEKLDLNTGETFYVIFIEDAAACCVQGLEVVFPEDVSIPIFLPQTVNLQGTIGVYEFNNSDFAFVNAEEFISEEENEE